MDDFDSLKLLILLIPKDTLDLSFLVMSAIKTILLRKIIGVSNSLVLHPMTFIAFQ